LDYFLYKLRFSTPVHFGADKPGIGIEKTEPTCHADTLFSAICTEAVALFGAEMAKTLAEKARAGKFLISDLMPYFYKGKDCQFCLPKPVLQMKKHDQSSEKKNKGEDPADKKKLKGISFIPLRQWEDYLEFITGKKGKFDCSVEFADECIFPRVCVSRDGGDGDPYLVGAYTFREGAGLYFIAGFEDDELRAELEQILNSLGYSGIGGKRTTGYGKFELDEEPIELDPDNNVYDDDKKLAQLIRLEKAKYYMTLSVISPKKEEINEAVIGNAFYSLVPRSGFVASSAYNDTPLKRKPLVMFNRGSCFAQKLEGDVPDVSDKGKHPVYRYGKAMMIGVKL
jgi:CRISPR-associated protein Csm4